MPEGDDVYLTIAEALPYGDYVSTAYNIVDGILNFGKESKRSVNSESVSLILSSLSQTRTSVGASTGLPHYRCRRTRRSRRRTRSGSPAIS